MFSCSSCTITRGSDALLCWPCSSNQISAGQIAINKMLRVGSNSLNRFGSGTAWLENREVLSAHEARSLERSCTAWLENREVLSVRAARSLKQSCISSLENSQVEVHDYLK